MVTKLCKAAESSLAKGQGEQALREASEAMAKALHLTAEELVLAGAMANVGQSNAWEATGKEIMKVYRQMGNPSMEAMATNMQADILICSRETTKALKLAQRAQDAYRSLGDKAGEATVMYTIVNAYVAKSLAGVNPQLEMTAEMEQKLEKLKEQRASATDSALGLAKELVSLFRDEGNRKAEAEAMDKVALVHMLKDETEQCKQLAREERSIYQELNDVQGEAAALHTIVNANLQNEDDFDDAVIAAKDVLKLYRGRDKKTFDEDKGGCGLALHTLAQVQLQRFELTEALEAAEEALQYYEQAGMKKDGMVPVLHTLARIQSTNQKTDEALTYMKQAVEITREVGDRAGESGSLHSLAYLEMSNLFSELMENAQVFSDEHNLPLESSWTYLDEALYIAREQQMPEGEAAVLDTIKWAMEQSRRIHIKIAEPVKTIYLVDQADRTQTVAVHIFDSIPPAQPEALQTLEEGEA